MSSNKAKFRYHAGHIKTILPATVEHTHPGHLIYPAIALEAATGKPCIIENVTVPARICSQLAAGRSLELMTWDVSVGAERVSYAVAAVVDGNVVDGFDAARTIASQDLAPIARERARENRLVWFLAAMAAFFIALWIHIGAGPLWVVVLGAPMAITAGVVAVALKRRRIWSATGLTVKAPDREAYFAARAALSPASPLHVPRPGGG